MPEHIILSGITAAGLTKIGLISPEEALFIIGANCLDVDHIFSMIAETNSFNIKKWIKTALRKQKIMQPGYFIFHTIEFTIIFTILSLLSAHRITKIFAASWLLHLFYDITWYIRYHKTNLVWTKHWTILNWKKLWKENYRLLRKS